MDNNVHFTIGVGDVRCARRKVRSSGAVGYNVVRPICSLTQIKRGLQLKCNRVYSAVG